MPAPLQINRPHFTAVDIVAPEEFNAVTIYSAEVPDATPADFGVIKIAGDLEGPAAEPRLKARSISAAKLFAFAAGSILANFTGSSGDAQAVTLSSPIVSFLQAPNAAAARAAIGADSGGGSGPVNASDIVGLIQASQIQEVNATTITGPIVAGQIGSVNASAITGTITAGQIGSVNTSSLIGQVLASQIAAVNATSITGVLQASQINTVNASSIVGQILSTQINSLAVTKLEGLIQSTQIQTIAANQVTGLIQSDQISTLSTTKLSGAITAGQISTVNAGSIQGVIVTSQLADGIINSLRLLGASSNFRLIERVATLPSLPAAAYPLGAVVLRSSDRTFWKAGASAWAQVSASDELTGALTAYDIQSVNASTIIGLITAAQIGSVNATTLNGLIQAAQIEAVNASSIVGGIQASQITTVNTTSLVGQVQASQINAVNASSISGFIQSTQIGSIDASTITVGLLQSTQIGSINAATITVGLLQATQINTVNATSIVGGITASQITSVNTSSLVGQVQASQIFAVNATTIAGLITASQIGSINAASITIGLIGDSQIDGISAGKLVTGTIAAARIGAGTIDATKLNVTSLAAITANLGTITTGTMDISSGSYFDRLQIQSGLLRQGAFSVQNSGSISTVLTMVTGDFSKVEIGAYGSTVPAYIALKNPFAETTASLSSTGYVNFRALTINNGTTDVATIGANGNTVLPKLTISSYGIADGFGISFVNDNNKMFEYYGINLKGQGGLWPVRVSNCALVMGAVGYGSSFDSHRIYFQGTDVYLYRNGDELWVNDSAGARRI